MKEFKKIKNFIFDCDGVLYDDLEGVFGQVSKRMTEYISKKLNLSLEKAKELQTNYFHKYNTSLNGLMIHHDINPQEFLKYVHDINLDFLKKDLKLRKELLELKTKKFIFTNGSHEHASNITKTLGISDLFDGFFDITDCNFIPKPSIEPYRKLIDKFDIKPSETVFIEDIAINLEPAKKLGMKTVWLKNNEYWGKKDSDKKFVDLKIENLSSFLKEINIIKQS
ncbi:pyrimidine 5'-nucleotidase [Candidatus Pelagibacter sp.]|nr:pyrimidine 5'-nucleotidase [Candidatus Pelagibacter sp.]